MQNSSTLKRRRIDQIFYFLPQFLLAMKLQSQAETNVGTSVDHTCSFWGDARRRAYCTRASCGGVGCFMTLPFEDSPVDDSKGLSPLLARLSASHLACWSVHSSTVSHHEVRILLSCLTVRSAHSSCVGSRGSCTPFIV